MKKNFIASLVVCSTIHVAAQQMPAVTMASWTELVQMSKCFNTITAQQCAHLPVYRINNRWHVSLMGKMNASPQWQQMSSLGVIRGCTIGNIATIKVPLQHFHQIDFSHVFSYIEIPERIQPHLHKVIKDVRADSVHHGINLPQAYTGKDVMIGVTDWGFDYTHPMFYDTLLQQTRIAAAWDQYKQEGIHPANFPYGAEYNSVSQLLNAGSDTANIYSYHTHGTHVAGIAGGSGAGVQFRGMAPEAQFLFVTFLIDAASVLDAFAWMKQKADEQDKRLVINMSWGLYYIGTLDGNSLLSQAIDQWSNQGVVFVSSAGNNGNNNFHIKKTFDNDIITSRIAFDSYSNPNLWGQSITAWGEPEKSFDLQLQIYNGVGIVLDETPVFSSATTAQYIDSIMVINTNDTIWYNLSAENANPLNNRPHMRLRVKNTNPQLYVVMRATATDGTVHFWNLVELTTGVGNWGLPFISYGSTGMSGNSQYSIGEPACTASVIAVGSYEAQWYSSGGTLMAGDLSSFTSSGPLLTEVMKPDIAAPGENVVSSISHYTDAFYSQYDQIIFNGVEYEFAKMSGTSMSSPCVAGIVALMLEANPDLTPLHIKQILQATAREDEDTGDISTPPGHPRWGYGKVNAYAAVQMALQFVRLDDENDTNGLFVFPNPANDLVQIISSNSYSTCIAHAIAMDGKVSRLNVHNGVMDTDSLSPGMYVLVINMDGREYRTTVVKQ